MPHLIDHVAAFFMTVTLALNSDLENYTNKHALKSWKYINYGSYGK